MLPFDGNELRIITVIVILAVASYYDVKSREVHDILWVIGGVTGVVLLIFEENILSFVVDIGIAMIAAPIALVLWRTGLFGGADAFAIIIISFITPGLTLSGSDILPTTILTNSALLFVLPFMINFTRNGIRLLRHDVMFEDFDENIQRKIVAMFIGFKAKNAKFAFSIETGQKQKKFSFSLHNADTAKFNEKNDIWVTFATPYMLFILSGFLIQIFYGDILFSHI
ncbi:A24 family peptidase C-terminal domain-containing protein [Nitrosopumilus sp. Nsub]|uniref:A24 family peptidase C-terminal domain-containing protein n=1 Tax=Nitrosopumilus sp. Nsub TaxID=1776294 RepID=UPI00083326A0|nr:A24 family peptidase C-terminal domain-containing protein [Nitrosopumilus sp. Nsub]